MEKENQISKRLKIEYPSKKVKRKMLNRIKLLRDTKSIQILSRMKILKVKVLRLNSYSRHRMPN